MTVFSFEFLFGFLLNDGPSLMHYSEGRCDIAGCQRGHLFALTWQ